MAIFCADSLGRFHVIMLMGLRSMLMGCCELHKIEAYSSIVEGDSFLATKWGSRSSKCAWRLADWVEEIHQILAQLNCSFQCIVRGY